MFHRFVYLILLLSVIFKTIDAEVYEECEDVEPGTYVSYSQSCSAYIYCDNDDSIMDECDEGQYFDGESCDDKENVECPLDEVAEEGDAGNEGDEGGDGDGDGDGVADGNGEEETDTSAETVTQDVATTDPIQKITFETTTSPLDNVTLDILDIPPVIKEFCPQTDDPKQIILIANRNSCSDFYVCYHGHAIGMHCMDHLHFNVATGKCDFPKYANCKLTTTGETASGSTTKCLPHMTEFFPHPTKCNYFYYCVKGYQTLQQCPFYYGWDIEKRSCVHMGNAKCYNDAT